MPNPVNSADATGENALRTLRVGNRGNGSHEAEQPGASESVSQEQVESLVASLVPDQQIDVSALAAKVFALLKEESRVERERAPRSRQW